MLQFRRGKRGTGDRFILNSLLDFGGSRVNSLLGHPGLLLEHLFQLGGIADGGDNLGRRRKSGDQEVRRSGGHVVKR